MSAWNSTGQSPSDARWHREQDALVQQDNLLATDSGRHYEASDEQVYRSMLWQEAGDYPQPEGFRELSLGEQFEWESAYDDWRMEHARRIDRLVAERFGEDEPQEAVA